VYNKKVGFMSAVWKMLHLVKCSAIVCLRVQQQNIGKDK